MNWAKIGHPHQTGILECDVLRPGCICFTMDISDQKEQFARARAMPYYARSATMCINLYFDDVEEVG